MNKLKNCRLLIADYYESLRFEVDIYTEELLKKTKEINKLNERVEILNNSNSSSTSRYIFKSDGTGICEPFGLDPYSDKYTFDEPNGFIKLPENVTLEEYFIGIRSKVINELKIREKEALGNYESNPNKFKLDEKTEIADKHERDEMLRVKLFLKKFCFLLNFDELRKSKISRTSSKFKLITIVTDFYLSPSQIKYLKYNNLKNI
jgi:hypothetical protein